MILPSGLIGEEISLPAAALCPTRIAFSLSRIQRAFSMFWYMRAVPKSLAPASEGACVCDCDGRYLTR